MKYALAIVIPLVLVFAVLAYLLADPSLFLAGVISIPVILNALPWGLLPNPNAEPHERSNPIGFLGQVSDAADDYADEDKYKSSKRR